MALRASVRCFLLLLAVAGNVSAAPRPILNDAGVSSGYRWVIFDPPAAGFSSQAITVNNSGDIGGIYYTDSGSEHMYLRRDGRFDTLDFPSVADARTTY